ncbi:MAG TPA: response regulator [Ignavibacteriaceae bacterium]
MNSILLISNNSNHQKQIQEICDKISFDLTTKHTITDYILELEDKVYQTVIIDYNNEDDFVKTVQITKKIRPRLPIIFISGSDDKELLQKIYNEGVFYVYVSPLNEDILTEVLKSSIIYKMKEDHLINKFTN